MPEKLLELAAITLPAMELPPLELERRNNALKELASSDRANLPLTAACDQRGNRAGYHIEEGQLAWLDDTQLAWLCERLFERLKTLDSAIEALTGYSKLLHEGLQYFSRRTEP